ncbi:MAG: multidrug effflux MFS transporter [Pseudomonadota bacterium]
MNTETAVAADAPNAAGSPHPSISFVSFVSLLAALVALNAMATDIMLPALPDMGATLRAASTTEVQSVITAYLVGFGLGQIFMGLVSDRFGRRIPMLAGLAVYCVASLVVVISGDLTTVLIARFMQGVGGAAPRVIVTAAVRDCYSDRPMAKVMSLVMMVFMAAPIVAPALGQLTLALAPWQVIFAMLALYGAVLLAICWLRFPETLPPERRIEIRRAEVIGGFGAVLGDRQTMGYVLAAGTVFGALFGYINTSQQLLVEVHGLGAWFPAVFAATAVSIAVASFVNARLVERHGMRLLSHSASCLFLLVSLAMLGLDLVGALSTAWLIGLMVVIALLMGLVFPNFNTLAMTRQGSVAGIAASVTGAGSTLLGAVVGYVIGQAFDGTATPMALGFVSMAAATLAALFYAERGRLFRSGQGA